ncbi:cell wall hydrolase [Halalkalibacterium ligniniphilum]|uniref:cell wall hydrolase n=1 Tax=Halalkalibacterium ligniniphilum TaxID=1134413 RepID=UPI00034788C0|nr:cell wall hydrolase [Halalkalibacterium ligniniphilum]
MPFICLILCFFSFQPEAEGAVLKYGHSAVEVKELQQKLIVMDYLHTSATGYYGTHTQKAVRQFQTDFNLLVDGIAGPQTLQMLNDVEKIARIVHGEARGEYYEGQVAVAAVVRNRLYSDQFPSTVDGVLFQQNAFTAVQDGQYNLTPNRYAYAAVKDAWLGWDPTGGSTYYYNPRIATSEWIYTRTVEMTIGNHVFAK